MPIKLIIAGGRHGHIRIDQLLVLDYIVDSIRPVEIVNGGATGIDEDARNWAKQRKLPLSVFPADWETHGRSAGPIRNKEMAEYADALIAFPGGRGTENMRGEARSAGLPILVIEDGATLYDMVTFINILTGRAFGHPGTTE